MREGVSARVAGTVKVSAAPGRRADVPQAKPAEAVTTSGAPIRAAESRCSARSMLAGSGQARIAEGWLENGDAAARREAGALETLPGER